jgi:hypothetical protein
MKKGILISIIVLGILFTHTTYATTLYKNCEYKERKKEKSYDKWLDSSYNDANRSMYYDLYNTNKDSYNNCIDSEHEKYSEYFET